MAQPKPTLILHNARVLTMSRAHPRASLVAIAGGCITHVGSEADLPGLRSRESRVIDCQGETIMPGFVDAHIHLLAYAASLLSVDCSPDTVDSVESIQAMVRQRAAGLPAGAWIRATGYDEFHLHERRHPTRWELDQAAPQHPVKLIHRSGHACVLNSLALSLAGIDMATEEPPGGTIERDVAGGEPNGLLLDMEDYLSRRSVATLSKAELEHGVALASQRLLAAGITSVQDATRNGLSDWHYLEGLKQRGLFAPRLSAMLDARAVPDFLAAGMGPRQGDHHCRLGPAKVVLTTSSGRLHPPREELEDLAWQAHQAGFQLAIHAMEPQEVEAAVAALAQALTRLPREDHRHRIEHCALCPPALLASFPQLGIQVVTQPAFLYYSGERYLAQIPAEHQPWLYRVGSLLRAKVPVAASSDAPVTPPSPLLGIWAVVTRRSQQGNPVVAQESASPQDALKLFTVGGAYALFEGATRGSIAAGRLADLVLLSSDPLGVPTDAIKDLRVSKTILGGRVV